MDKSSTGDSSSISLAKGLSGSSQNLPVDIQRPEDTLIWTPETAAEVSWSEGPDCASTGAFEKGMQLTAGIRRLVEPLSLPAKTGDIHVPASFSSMTRPLSTPIENWENLWGMPDLIKHVSVFDGLNHLMATELVCTNCNLALFPETHGMVSYLDAVLARKWESIETLSVTPLSHSATVKACINTVCRSCTIADVPSPSCLCGTKCGSVEKGVACWRAMDMLFWGLCQLDYGVPSVFFLCLFLFLLSLPVANYENTTVTLNWSRIPYPSFPFLELTSTRDRSRKA